MDTEAKRRISALDMAEELLERDIELPLETAGLSMGGTIRNGERIVVRRVVSGELHPGDIVICRKASGFVAHRIIRKWRRDGRLQVQTKGDGHLSPDPPVPADEVAGRVVAVRRGNRLLDLDSRAGRMAARLQLWYGRFVWAVYRLLRNAVPSSVRAGGKSRLLLDIPRRILLFPSSVIARVCRTTRT